MSAYNGRHARFYACGPPGDRLFLPVTYHKLVRGRLRQLTISSKLLRRHLLS